jgi:hypothetical protein
MSAIRRPVLVWLTLLGLASLGCAAWLLSYFLEPRRYFLSLAHLTTLSAQLAAAVDPNTQWSLRVFLLCPWLAALLALIVALLAWRVARGSRLATGLGLASVLAVPATYAAGIWVLRRAEDDRFFPRSPWVVQFRYGCLTMAILAVVVCAWTTWRWWQARSRGSFSAPPT